MINWFKKHFIPHTGNNHRPHFLQRKTTCGIILVVLFLEVFTFLIPTLTNINKTGGMAAVLPAVLASLTNQERESQNLSNLTTNPILVKAAELKAKDMATKGYFAHTSPEGKTPWYWLNIVGYKYQYAGENLAVNFNDSQDVTRAWMDSPTHRANIVKDKYTEVGTAIANGIYEGRNAVFVVQVYANPLIIKKPQVISKKIEVKKVITNNTVKKTTEPAKILGAEVVNLEEESVLGVNTDVAIQEEKTVPTKEVVPVETPVNPTFFQKAFASPRNTTNTVLTVIFEIIIFSLLLYILIKRRNHHKDLLINALLVVAVLGALFVVNYYISNHNTLIIQSLDYSNNIQ